MKDTCTSFSVGSSPVTTVATTEPNFQVANKVISLLFHLPQKATLGNERFFSYADKHSAKFPTIYKKAMKVLT